ncbi:MAG TPA: DUF1003 domain-containing protein [Rhodothermales bacterium]|nr:DUF1003 domain-containing protein [Rhodothermales bacterium]
MQNDSSAKAGTARYWDDVREQKQEILNIRAGALKERGPGERLLARIAHVLGHPTFFLVEALFHLGWLLLNSGWIPGITPWDPYPFSFLLSFASVQALFIALLILMHSQEETRIRELREETDLQVALHSERESTKLLQMMVDVHRALGIPLAPNEQELREMMNPLDPERLRATTEEHLDESERDAQ